MATNFHCIHPKFLFAGEYSVTGVSENYKLSQDQAYKINIQGGVKEAYFDVSFFYYEDI